MSRKAATVTACGVFAVLGLAVSCSSAPQPGAPTSSTAPTTTTVAPQAVLPPTPSTVYVAPPETIVVPAPSTVYMAPRTVTRAPPAQTSCEWMHDNGYSYAQAYNAWLNAGSPSLWDADHDGYPCEQSFGNRN
jgi:hypothetical protein